MKYLENGELTAMSSQLCDAMLGDSRRSIRGRIEAYSMKRGGKSEKKYAFALGQRYKEEIDDLQEDLAALTAGKKMKKVTLKGGKGSTSSSTNVDATSATTRKRSNSTPADPLEITKHPKIPGQLSPHQRSSSDPEFTVSKNGGGGVDEGNSSIVTVKKENLKGQENRRPRSQSFEDFTLDGLSSKTTSLGDFSEGYTRRLMTDLVLTLNASHPDYDFSNVKPNQFQKVTARSVRKTVFQSLSELAAQKESSNWLLELWSSIDNVISVTDCDIYTFDGFEEDDDGQDTALWTFHYFFINRSMRRIVYFTCSERVEEEIQLLDEDTEEDGQAVSGNVDSSIVDDFDWTPNPAGGISFDVTVA